MASKGVARGSGGSIGMSMQYYGPWYFLFQSPCYFGYLSDFKWNLNSFRKLSSLVAKEIHNYGPVARQQHGNRL